MHPPDARTLARQLMDQHGLSDWTLVFDRAKTRAGVCRPQRREIGLSLPLTARHTPDEVRETVLHEIAHALVGIRHGHDRVWQATAVAIGATGQRCVSSEAERVDASWQSRCPQGHELTRHRRPTRVTTCGECSPTFDLEQVLTWTFHGRAVPMHPNYEAELTALRRGTPAPTLTLLPGDRVVIRAQGPYDGVVGTVVKRGRSRYHVRVSGGVLTVPFALAAPG